MTPGGDERGDTLIELLISIVIIGLAVATLLGGMAAAIDGSDVHRRDTDEDVILVGAAEALKDDVRNPYTACATSSTYNAVSSISLPTGWTVSPGTASSSYTFTSPNGAKHTMTVSIAYWNGSSFGSTCTETSAATGNFLTMQQLTLALSGTTAATSVSLVRRAPCSTAGLAGCVIGV